MNLENITLTPQSQPNNDTELSIPMIGIVELQTMNISVIKNFVESLDSTKWLDEAQTIVEKLYIQ